MINRSSKRSFETCSPILPCALRFEGFLLSLLSFSLSLFFLDVRAESRETGEEGREGRFRVSSILFGSRVSESRFQDGRKMRSGLLFPSWPATTHFRSLNSSVGMNGVRLDQIRYVRLNQIHVPQSGQIADRSAAHGCFFFSFLSFFLSFFLFPWIHSNEPRAQLKRYSWTVGKIF